MTKGSDGTSPRTYARFAGWLYLCVIVGGLFAEFYVAGKLIVSGDARSTTTNILGSESLFRAALVSEILMVAAYVGVALLLYLLLKPVSKNLALSSLFFATVGNVLWVVGSVYQIAAIRLLRGGTGLSAFNADQLQALALQNLKVHGAALNVGMVFFGIYCVLLGILIYQAGYLPKAIGVLLVVGGACDFMNEIVGFVAPSIAVWLPEWVQLPGFVAELSLTVWLIVVGVNVDNWRRRVSLTGEPG